VLIGDDPDDQKLTYEYATKYGATAVLWKLKKYKAIFLSTTDAEYLTATETTWDLSWIQNIFEGMKVVFSILVKMTW